MKKISKQQKKKFIALFMSAILAAIPLIPILPPIEAKADTSYVSDNEDSCFYANVNVWEDTSKNNLLHTYTKAMGNIKGSTYDDDEDYFVQKMTLKDFTRNLPLYADNKYTASSTFGNYQMSIASELTDFNGNTSNKINAVSDSYYIEDTADDYTYDTIVKYTTLEKEDAFNACLINFNDTDHSIYKYGIRFKNDEVKALYPGYATYTVTWFEGTAKEQVTGIDDTISISADDLADLTNKKVKISNAFGESKEISLITENFFDYEIPDIEGAELTGIMPCLYLGPDSQEQMYIMVYSDGTAFFLGNGEEAYALSEKSDNLSHISNVAILENFKTTAITDFNSDLSQKYAPNLKHIQRIFSDSDDSKCIGYQKFSDFYYPCMVSKMTLIPNVIYDGSPGPFQYNYSIGKIIMTKNNRGKVDIGYNFANECPFLEEITLSKQDDGHIVFSQAPVCNSGWGTEDGLIINTNDVIVDATFLYDKCKTNVFDEFPSTVEGLTMAIFNSGKNTQDFIKVDISIFKNMPDNRKNSFYIDIDNKGIKKIIYTGEGNLFGSVGMTSNKVEGIYFDKNIKPTLVSTDSASYNFQLLGDNINVYAYYYNSDGTENDFSKFMLNKDNFSKICYGGQFYYINFEDAMASLINIETTQIIDRNTSLNDVVNKIDKSQISGKIIRKDGSITTLRADLGDLGAYLGINSNPNNIYFDNNVTEYTDNRESKDYYVVSGRYYDPVIPKLAITASGAKLNSTPLSSDFTLLIEKSDDLVSRELESIEIVKPPKKTNYTYGESFDKTGMKVNATYKETYESGRTKTVTDEDVSFDVGNAPLTDKINFVEVSVTDTNNITKMASQDITVNDVIDSTTLESISIYNHAAKTEYNQGGLFDRAGLSVDAVYKDVYKSGKEILRTVPRVPYYITDEDIPLDLNKTYMEITYTDNGITRTAKEPIVVNKYIVNTELDSIYIDVIPEKTEYLYGDSFNDTGMVVNALYKNTWSDDSITMSEIKNVRYDVDCNTPLTLKDYFKTVSYTDGVTKNVDLPITVKNYLLKSDLDDISIRKNPNKTEYLYGEIFDKSGMIVDAYYKDTYADGSIINRTVENISVTADKTKLYDTDTDITISYTDVITKSKKINISVKDIIKNILLDSIKIRKNPDKIVYDEGEVFDSTGMEVDAVYKNIWLSGKETYTTAERVAYDIVNKDKQLTIADKKIEAAFTDKGITKTESLNIAVNPVIKATYLDSIIISRSADKTEYLYGETFDKSGMIVDAYYKNIWSDGNVTYSKRYNVPFTVDNKDNLTLDNYFVTVSFTDKDITKTAKEPILVKDAIKETTLEKINIATSADKNSYYVDEIFDRKGLAVNAYYKNIWYSGKVTTIEIKNVIYDIKDEMRKLETKDTYMEITYTDNGITRTAEQKISVNCKHEDKIPIQTEPGNESKVEPEKTEVVNTADNLNVYYYLLLLAISSISLNRIKKRKKI